MSNGSALRVAATSAGFLVSAVSRLARRVGRVVESHAGDGHQQRLVDVLGDQGLSADSPGVGLDRGLVGPLGCQLGLLGRLVGPLGCQLGVLGSLVGPLRFALGQFGGAIGPVGLTQGEQPGDERGYEQY